ncbi:tetratricopeptide repeat protein [Fusibacter sp. JL216-2]|uniref:tetratricopeptide repeat protein n=1 Tax=Fusibacter sp. JL216-2 TaxID=3071453 RepID=UPI003D33DB57
MKIQSKKILITSVVTSSLLMSACTTVSASQVNIEKLYEENKYDEIISEINQEELIAVQDFDALYLVASSYHLTGAHEDANEIIDRILVQNDEMKYRILKYNILESLGLYELQDELVTSTLEEYRDKYDALDFDGKSNYCYWLILNNENEEAIEKYERLLEEVSFIYMKDPLYNNLAWASLNIYDYEKAKEYSLESLEIQPGDTITLTNLGNSYYGLDEYSEAREAFEEAIKSNPNNSYAVYGLANTLDAMDDLNSIEYWEKYVELQPYDFDGWYNIYSYYSETNEVDEVTMALERIVQIQPSYSYYVKELLNLYYETDEKEKVEETLNRFERNNDPLQYDLLLADYTFETLSEDDGYDLYVQILNEYELEYWDLTSIIETLYYSEKNEYFNSYVSEIESIKGSNYRLEIESEFYYEYGEYEKLIDVAEKLIIKDTSNSYAYELLADGLYYMDDYENAYENYSNALKYGESTFYLKISLVDCAIYNRNLDEARSILQELLIDNSDSAIIFAYKARIDMLEGNSASAIEMMKESLSISPYLDYVLDKYEELETLKSNDDIKALIDSANN